MTESSHPPEPGDDGRDRALTTISDDYPGWETWGGPIAGLLYAKRREPQIVVRATTTEGLREEIERAERKRGLR